MYITYEVFFGFVAIILSVIDLCFKHNNRKK